MLKFLDKPFAVVRFSALLYGLLAILLVLIPFLLHRHGLVAVGPDATVHKMHIKFLKEVMWEHTRDLAERGKTQYIGHIAAFPTKMQLLAAVVSDLPPGSRHCEVGLNEGHSAALALRVNPYISVSTYEISPSPEAMDIFNTKYPGRLTLVEGDSTKTLQDEVMMRKMHCDSIFIDGNSEQNIVIMDAVRLCSLSNPLTPILIDDDDGEVISQILAEKNVTLSSRSCIKDTIIVDSNGLEFTFRNYQPGDIRSSSLCLTQCLYGKYNRPIPSRR